MNRRMLSGALALSLAATLAGAQPASAARTRVRIVDNAFEPKRKAIPQGSRVTWTNRGDTAHTVTSNTGKFDSGTLDPGESFTKRFNRTGVFKYHCEIHPEMTGKILPTDV